NEVLVQYAALAEKAQEATRYPRERFDPDDENAGIKKLVLAKALRDTRAAGQGGAGLRRRLVELAHVLRGWYAASEDVRNLMLARLLADLLTLCGFLAEHEAEVDALLAQRGL